MADEEKKQNADSPVKTEHLKKGQQTDSEPFEGEIFEGDEYFFQILDRAEKASQSIDGFLPADWAVPGQVISGKKSISTTNALLIAALLIVAVIFAYPLYQIAIVNPTRPMIVAPPAEHVRYSRSSESQIFETGNTNSSSNADFQSQIPQLQNKKLIDNATQPISLSLANNYFTSYDYENAIIAYNRLYQALSEANTDQPIIEFLQFRVACCLWETRQNRQAETIFRSLSISNSPAIRALANYYQARIELKRDQFLEAGTYAYRAMAVTPAITADTHWALSIQKDCAFIINQALTRQTLILGDYDSDIPEKLWALPVPLDPFSSLTKTQLTELLESGTGQLNKALLSPQINRLNSAAPIPKYSITSYAASFEELIARFATNADLEIKLNLQPHSKDLIKRPLFLYQPEVTVNEFLTVAAGCLGLLAQIDSEGDKTIVTIENPGDYTKLQEHRTTLSKTAISLWQEYLIKYHDDKSVANANFALALLLAQNNQIPEAIEQFRYVADRFAWSRLSPYALFHSSRLKADMQDYAGARQDLEELVVQYDDMGLTPRAYLYLAKASINAGLLQQATEIYHKVYNLDFSAESKATASFNAAKCMYEVKNYPEAQTWLVRYINLAKDVKLEDLHSAYLLLGKTQLALGDSQNACNAFSLAISGRISDDDKMEIVAVLLDNQKQKSDLIQALDVLEAINPNQLSQEQATNLMLLKSRVMRMMGLPDKAKEMISSKIVYIFKANLQGKAYCELAKCCIENNEIQAAYNHLTTALTLVESGALANQTRLELANVAIIIGKNNEAISLCLQILELKIPDETRKQALDILAKAYKDQKQFDKALKALIAQSQITEEQKKNSKDSSLKITGKAFDENTKKRDS